MELQCTEKNYNMKQKEKSEKVVEIIKDYKSRSNKDLIFAMDFIQEDFNLTKDSLLKLTEHLDKLEITYNTIIKEYESRTNGAK
jgi:hypothetical protein